MVEKYEILKIIDCCLQKIEKKLKNIRYLELIKFIRNNIYNFIFKIIVGLVYYILFYIFFSCIILVEERVKKYTKAEKIFNIFDKSLLIIYYICVLFSGFFLPLYTIIILIYNKIITVTSLLIIIILMFIVISLIKKSQNILGGISYLLLFINIFLWLAKFNPLLSLIFLFFLILIGIFFVLRFILLYTKQKIKINFLEYMIFLIVTILSFLYFSFLIINNDYYEAGIRITKGDIRKLKDKKLIITSDILKDNKLSFNIGGEEKNGYILEDSRENPDIKKAKINIMKNIIHKGNSSFMLLKKAEDKSIEIKKSEIIFLNNRNTIILDKDNNISKDVEDISIEGKLLIIHRNNSYDYIFLDNSIGWGFVKEKVKIKEDKIKYNLINLGVFTFIIIYYCLKLFGKKTEKYYDMKIIKKIKDTERIFESKKVLGILLSILLSISGISSFLNIILNSDVEKMIKGIEIFNNINLHILLTITIILLCIITSKEISDLIDKENEK